MLTEARVAVVGGGISGCSLAYHLTHLGVSDIALLEQHELTSGTTWHAAGLCTQFSASHNLMTLLRYSVELYQALEAETGHPVGYRRCGSLRLAQSRDRLDEFEHVGGLAELVGVPFEIVPPERIAELHPLLDLRGVAAAAHLPTDGWLDPASLANAYAKAASAGGARIYRRTRVRAIERSRGAWLLSTSQGQLRVGIVVNAAGQWAREVARMAGGDLPLVPMSHHYVLTEPIDEVAALESELPVVRDPDASFYARQDGAGLLVGPFERDPRPWGVGGIPRGFHDRLLRPELGRIAGALEAAGERIPALARAGISKAVHGPDAYTPDGRCLMGPVPGLRAFYALAGFSIFGIVFSGGAGKYLAEWIVDGQPGDSMWELDVRRFGRYALSTSYLVARASDVYEREYAIHYPEQERPAGRPLKTSPLYDRLLARGAVYGARFGWERPLWFARAGAAREEYSFRRPSWHAAVGDECRALRDAVGVLDQTSFAKYEVSGPAAEAFLGRLAANALPTEAGRIALTQLLTPKGGIECDVTVTRLVEDRFYVVSAAATEAHDEEWIRRHLPEDGSVRLENVTARYGVLTVAGPRSRELLEALTDADLSREAFPFFSSRELELGMVPVRALRVSYVGELGYELHHPLEYQRRLFDLLLEAGEPLGLVDFGYRALDSLRLEKAYRLWGADLSADYTPLEAGLERFVRLEKGDFIGREALLRQAGEGVGRELVCLVVDAGEADAHGYEPVLDGDRPIGFVTSGGFGHRVGASIALAYVPPAYAAPGTDVSVRILGERRAATVAAEPLYDPGNERLHA